MLTVSEETPFQVHNSLGVPPATLQIAWAIQSHALPLRSGLAIPAGVTVSFELSELPSCGQLLVAFGANSNCAKGTRLIVRFKPRRPWFARFASHPVSIVLLEETVAEFDNAQPWKEITVSLDNTIPAGSSGQICVECSAPAGTGLVLYDLVLATPATLSLNRARAHGPLRARNEIAHFSAVYADPFFQTAVAASTATPQVPPKMNAYTLATNAYREQLVTLGYAPRPLNFAARLQARLAQIAHEKPTPTIEVMSLCSGAARIEHDIFKLHQQSIGITLFDLNEQLLKMATRPFEGFASLKITPGDINRIRLPPQTYDIVVCVSALHHVVELEHVLAAVAASLKPDGEFWIIGEYVGRNGARLWDDSYAIANQWFKDLPAHLRLNHTHYGAARVDVDLPNYDCSVSTFEGIRSEDIEPGLCRYFHPVASCRDDCFLWRLFDLAYMSNFDTAAAEHRNLIFQAAQSDARHLVLGTLRPTSMDGVFMVKHR